MTDEELAVLRGAWEQLGRSIEPLDESNEEARFIASAKLDVDILLAEVDRQRAENKRVALQARREALEQVQENVVAHTFDTTVGRKIDDYITERGRFLTRRHRILRECG